MNVFTCLMVLVYGSIPINAIITSASNNVISFTNIVLQPFGFTSGQFSCPIINDCPSNPVATMNEQPHGRGRADGGDRGRGDDFKLSGCGPSSTYDLNVHFTSDQAVSLIFTTDANCLTPQNMYNELMVVIPNWTKWSQSAARFYDSETMNAPVPPDHICWYVRWENDTSIHTTINTTISELVIDVCCSTAFHSCGINSNSAHHNIGHEIIVMITIVLSLLCATR